MASKPIPEHHLKKLEHLSSYLRELRFTEGLTQKEVSEDLAVHLNTLIRAETSKNVTLLSLFELAEYYQIDVHELFLI